MTALVFLNTRFEQFTLNHLIDEMERCTHRTQAIDRFAVVVFRNDGRYW